MKKAFTAVLMTLALVALAAPPVKYWNTPMQSVDHDKQVQKRVRDYLNEGFILVSVEENAYRYLVPPEGDDTWGTVTVTLRTQATGNSLQTTWVTVTCYVEYVWAEDGYIASGFDITEQTVY